jgi:ribose/xylose/arabinose/galactoside ABC-type transport system permease subunit
VLIVIFGILNPRFLSPVNWFHITEQVAVIAILAIGQTFIIATAGIDISQGSVVALSSMICALIIVDTHLGIVAGIVLTLALGALVGSIIGGSIVVLGVPPFIATLGMLAIALGAALLTTNGTPVFGLPDSFFTDSTDSGPDATVKICVDAALHRTPCPGRLTIHLPKA